MTRRNSLNEFTPMQQATPTPARSTGLLLSRQSSVGVGSGGGTAPGGAAGAAAGGVATSGAADMRPLELIKACVVAVTPEEKMFLEYQNAMVSSLEVSGNANSGPSAMTMATPTPLRSGGGFAPQKRGAVVVGGGAGAVGGGQGLLSRVEDGLTAFLVLAMGVLR